MKRTDVRTFHAAAVLAAQNGLSIRQFAKSQGTLANNVKARLYEALLAHGLTPVQFPEAVQSSPARAKQPANESTVKIYTGRAKVPYLMVKVPREVLVKSGSSEGDVFVWRLNKKGEVIGKNKNIEGR